MSTIKTTIKTEACSFSEYRIYPGKGQKFVARDGKVHYYLASKFARLARNKKKPAQLRWTQAWRRNNKKTKVEATQKRRVRRTIRVQKAVGGLTLDDIRNRKAFVQNLEAKNRARMAVQQKDDKKKGKDDKAKSKLPLSKALKFKKPMNIHTAKTKMHKMMKK